MLGVPWGLGGTAHVSREETMLSGMTSGALQIAMFHNLNKASLNQSLMRLASGKRVNAPEDNITDYLRANSIRSQYRNRDSLQVELGEWEEAMRSASSAAGTVLDNLEEMKELVYLAEQKIGDPATNQDELDSYQTQFMELAQSARSLVQDTNWVGESLLNNTGTIAEIYLSPGSTTSKLTLAPGVALDIANDITPLIDDSTNYSLNDNQGEIDAAEVLVENAMGDIKAFMGTVSGYVSTLGSQQNVNESIIQNLKSAESSLLEANEAEEMVNYTARNIRNQTSLAMLAQANASSEKVLLLYGITG